MSKATKSVAGGALGMIGLGVTTALGHAVVRTMSFVPPEEEPRDIEPVEVDLDAAIDHLQQLIRCKTVSNANHALEDDAEFERLIGLLPDLYPHVFEACTLTRMEDRALLFRWPGAEPGDPAVLMAHYDVVPVDEAAWQRDPFGGELVDGELWGRGALDTKVTFNGILFAANDLIELGFVPQRDVYFAFSGGEEVFGCGARHIVDWFTEQGITPELVLDEGGAVVEGVFPGVDKPCGLIGIAEKGVANVRLTASSNGGHASAPTPGSPVAKLAEAVDAIETNPMPLKMSEPVRQMFDVLGRYADMPYRALFANVEGVLPALDLLTRKTGGNLNALLRTTVAFTQMEGSSAVNVIPPAASVTANVRINPEDTVADVAEYFTKTIDDPEVKVEMLDCWEPSPVSRTDCEGWRRVARAVSDTWPDCVVSPYVMVQCSDSRQYRDLSDRVYRFSAYDATSDELATIHGNDERIRVEALRRSVEFFIRVLRQC